jgi:hypothetical protein
VQWTLSPPLKLSISIGVLPRLAHGVGLAHLLAVTGSVVEEEQSTSPSLPVQQVAHALLFPEGYPVLWWFFVDEEVQCSAGSEVWKR